MSDALVILSSIATGYMYSFISCLFIPDADISLRIRWGTAGIGWLYAFTLAYVGSYTGIVYGLYILFGLLLLVGAVIDKQYMILPDQGAIALVLLGAIRLWVMEASYIEAISMSISLLCIFGFIAWKWTGAMGLGDCKWMRAMAWWFSVETMYMVITLAFVLGSLGGLICMYRTRQITNHQRIPFGPYLAMSAYCGLIYQSIVG